jgi:predicted membrane protein
VRASCTAGEIALWDIRASGLFVQRTFKTDTFDTATNRLIVVLNCVFGDIKVW